MYLTPCLFGFELFYHSDRFLPGYSNLFLTTELYIVSLHIRVDIPNKPSNTEVSTRISFSNNFKTYK